MNYEHEAKTAIRKCVEGMLGIAVPQDQLEAVAEAAKYVVYERICRMHPAAKHPSPVNRKPEIKEIELRDCTLRDILQVAQDHEIEPEKVNVEIYDYYIELTFKYQPTKEQIAKREEEYHLKVVASEQFRSAVRHELGIEDE